MAASGKAKVALILGIAGTAFGGFQVYDRVYEWYDRKDFPPVFAIFGVGLLVLAFAVGKIKKPVFGILLVLAGAAYCVAMLKLGKTNMAEKMAGYQNEVDVQKAAAAVCAGTPNTAASDSPISGKRPLLGAGRRSGDKEWFSGGAAWSDLPKPRNLAELQLVACTEQILSFRTSCNYEGKDGAGAYSISKYVRSDTITVRKAKTAEVLGTKSFEGGEPSTNCDTEISVSSNSRESSHDVTGSDPSDKDETDFVRPFVEHPR